MHISPLSRESKQKRVDKLDHALRFMHDHPVGVLCMVDSNNSPHATTIYYSVDDDFRVTFMTKRRAKKADNLRHNNRLALVVHEPASQTAVQLKGLAEQITDIKQANEVFRAMLRASLHTSGSAIPPLSKLALGEYVAYRVIPKQVKITAFADPTIVGDYETSETIDF